MCGGNPIDFELKPHPGFLEIRPKVAVDQADRGEILDAGEAELLQFAQELVANYKWIGPANAGQHWRVLHRGKHFVRHLLHDLVGVAEGHQAGERTAAGHAVAPGVVDHDEIDSARLFALRADARPRTAADDWQAGGDFLARNRFRIDCLVSATDRSVCKSVHASIVSRRGAEDAEVLLRRSSIREH